MEKKQLNSEIFPKKQHSTIKNTANDTKIMKIKLIKSPKKIPDASPILEEVLNMEPYTKDCDKNVVINKENKLRDDLMFIEPKSIENMTALELEDYFEDDKSSELSDLDFSGSDSDYKKIKKKPGLNNNGYSSESDPINKKYTDAARNARNGSISINEFMEVENTVFEHL
ncbi:hypothetical protein AYI68_g3923 [Smittium mucronatum]|uniref:Uncharacterized protein n=1 Tax=Smittium mucronatum TaxID=133383 RepID=A0A1R0GYN7_9FUNG|nr:hypothetical protein AYI68_g3923 [Smittium mucronatum]